MKSVRPAALTKARVDYLSWAYSSFLVAVRVWAV